MSREKRVRKARAAKKRKRRLGRMLREIQRTPILNRSFMPFYDMDVEGTELTEPQKELAP